MGVWPPDMSYADFMTALTAIMNNGLVVGVVLSWVSLGLFMMIMRVVRNIPE